MTLNRVKIIGNIFFLLLCCLINSMLFAQKANKKSPAFTSTEVWNAGLPYINNFIPEILIGTPQNWAFVEGDGGVMYIGNGAGLIEFDGIESRGIPLANNSVVRSLAKSKDGKIYVGGSGDFGYLQKDSIGNTQYHSLSAKLEKVYSEFADIWSVVVLDNSVFFSSKKFLFRWDGSNIKVWKSKERFGKVYKVHKKIYISSKGVGILTLQGENLNLISNGDYFNNSEGTISLMQPLGGDKILLGQQNNGLFIFDDGKISVFNHKIQKLIKQSKTYNATLLMNGDYAIATINSGVYILNGVTGNIVERYGMEHGLPGNTYFAVYSASDGALWVGGDNGFSRINIMMPIRKFNKENGIKDRVRSVLYDGNTLYVGGNGGVSYLEKKNSSASFNPPEFKKINLITGNVWALPQIGSHKVAVLERMIFDIDGNNVASLIDSKGGRCGLKSSVYPNTTYISSKGILYQFNLVNNKLKTKVIAKLQEEIVKIIEEPNGDLWLSTYYNGVYKLKKTTTDTIIKDSLYPVQHYDTLAGLPTIEYNDIFYLDKKIYALNSSNGIYRFDKKSQLFSKDTFFMNQYDTTSVTGFYNSFVTDRDDVWHITGDNDGVRKIFNLNGNQISELPESKLFNNLKTFHIYEVDSIVFFSGPKGIIAYNRRMKIPKSKFHPVQLRKVFIKKDSLVYAGKNAISTYSFSYKQNAIQFEYSLPYYTKLEKNEYQYILEGFDQDWSKWSLETKNNYTNIPEGTYTFRVKAKNIFGEISKEDSYVFTILPPWYRTWWAYLLYFLGAVFTILLFSQWRSKQLRAKNLALEKIVANRTEEISEKNVQLESQTERLKELDTMKTRLFANISHEFRTPLTLIKGPIEQLEQDPKKKLSVSNVKMIRRNANRLLKLVNQLLDLSKLESGNLALEPSEGNVYKSLRTAASSFSSHAAQRNMDYQIKIPSNKTLWASFDRDKLDKIVYNLLSNAFKFTDDDKKVSISVRFSKEQLKIEVTDSGCGIPSDRLPLIFDRFFQVDDSFTKEKAGTGIGLSLTKELVELMKGTIHVESEYKKGSVFKIMIPLEEIKSAQKEDKEEIKRKVAIKEKVISIKPKSKNLPTILIVEDHKDMRDFIKQQLEEHYQIIEAYNGQDGLEKAAKIMPDLIITDLMMPKLDGISLCKRLKKEINTSHIPIIMLTAKTGVENKIEGLETGADDYLTKPFHIKELHVRVKNLIEQRKKLRELFSKKDIINPKEVTVTSLDEQFLQKIIDVLEKEFTNSNFSLPQMRDELAMSNAQLHRKVKALTNQSPGELLRNFRLKRAAQILKQKGAYVTEVAYDVGFNNLSYFAKCFKEFYGVPPSVFIKKNN